MDTAKGSGLIFFAWKLLSSWNLELADIWLRKTSDSISEHNFPRA